MNNASIDVDARRTFREELRGRRVALRSFIPRDDIDDIEIVEAEDPEISATRQVLKVEAVERTGEVDALDVLESIDILRECAPTEVVIPSASVTDAFAIGIAAPACAPLAPPIPFPEPALALAPATAIAVTETAPLPMSEARIAERAPYAALDVEDDAFFAQNDSPSTGPVTFHLGDCYVDEVGPTIELHGAAPFDRRRRLTWIVGTVLACALVMTAAAAITEQTQTASNEPAVPRAAAAGPAMTAAPTPTVAPTVAPTPTTAASPATASTSASISPATTTAYPAIPEMDVRSLRAPAPPAPPAPPALALAGTIIGIPRRPLFVDGKRLQSSTAIVACGKHTVKSGAFRAAHVIDVPCGGSIALK